MRRARRPTRRARPRRPSWSSPRAVAPSRSPFAARSCSAGRPLAAATTPPPSRRSSSRTPRAARAASAGRSAGRPTHGEAERAVALAAVRQAGVERDRAVAGELRHVRRAAPADEDVAVAEQLRIAQEMRQHPVGPMRIGVLERDVHPLRVEREQQCARLRLLLRRGGVVEDADEAVRVLTHVVLPLEPRASAEREVAALAAEAPENPARVPARSCRRPTCSARRRAGCRRGRRRSS